MRAASSCGRAPTASRPTPSISTARRGRLVADGTGRHEPVGRAQGPAKEEGRPNPVLTEVTRAAPGLHGGRPPGPLHRRRVPQAAGPRREVAPDPRLPLRRRRRFAARKGLRRGRRRDLPELAQRRPATRAPASAPSTTRPSRRSCSSAASPKMVDNKGNRLGRAGRFDLLRQR